MRMALAFNNPWRFIIIILSCHQHGYPWPHSHHLSLSFIAFGRSSGLHPISSQRCCMSVRAGRPGFARPCEGVHRSRSFMSLSLLIQQCPACLVRLTWIVFVMGGRWPYSCCFVGRQHESWYAIRQKKLHKKCKYESIINVIP